MRLKSDLLELLEAVVDDRLDTVALEWDPRPAVTVVMASEGYPGHYERDRVIQNLEAADRMPDVKVFHAGTALRADPAIGREGRVVTDGGRVLNVTALGATLEEAQAAPTKPPAPSSSPAPGIAATSPAGRPRREMSGPGRLDSVTMPSIRAGASSVRRRDSALEPRLLLLLRLGSWCGRRRSGSGRS